MKVISYHQNIFYISDFGERVNKTNPTILNRIRLFASVMCSDKTKVLNVTVT